MPVNEIRDFIFENHFKRRGFSKESNYYSMKQKKKKKIRKKDLQVLATELR